MLTARDFSVMPVQIEGEPKPIERALRSRGSLMAGAFVDVEFGATWASIQDRVERTDGQWWQCRIVGHEGAIVFVVLDPKPSTAPFG